MVFDSSVGEGANLEFVVSLTGLSATAVTADYATADGTATAAGSDYTGSSGSFNH